MKNNLPWFTHESDARNNRKLKAIRTKFGFEGVGRFWTLNEIIAQSDNCRLDLKRKLDRNDLSDELRMNPDELDTFLEFLADPDECGIIIYTDGVVWNEHTQEDLEKTMTNREKSRAAYNRKTGKNDDSTGSLPETNGKNDDSTGRKHTQHSTAQDTTAQQQQEAAAESDESRDEKTVEKLLAERCFFFEPEECVRLAKSLGKELITGDFFDFLVQEARSRKPENLAGFMRRAMYYQDIRQKYRAKKARESNRRPDPPRKCPKCGGPVISADDRAMCKPCRILWLYDADARTWKEAENAIKAHAG